MQTPSLSIDSREVIVTTLQNIFESMLAMKIEPDLHPPPRVVEGEERIIGSVGFGGELVTGAVFLHLQEAFARRMTGAMLGPELETTASDTEINDVVGEISNMLAGGLKSRLCDAGMACAMSTPSIFRSTACQVETVPGVQQQRLRFRAGDFTFEVELHIKIVNPNEL